MKFLIMLILLWSIIIAWCSKSSWDLYFYKDKDNLDDKNKWVIIHDLKSIDECRNKAKDLSYDYDNYDYECVRWCKYDKQLKINICKETIR